MQASEPTLLLDESIARQNIEFMAKKAVDNGLTLKPHFKTHQSRKVGRWFRDYDVQNITVSSLKMAQYFARDGWDDITIAFPYHPRMSSGVNELAQSARISLLLSDPKAIPFLKNDITENVGVYIEIDTGSDRSGFSFDEKEKIGSAVKELRAARKLHFSGFYSHPGHSYRCRSANEIKSVHRDVISQMHTLKQNFSDARICVGDTPCCSVGENFESIDEISPGNFVFYDLMQHAIGSCNWTDIAVALACPVAAVYNSRNEIIVHGGAIHLSKDNLNENGGASFGKIVPFRDDSTWGDPIKDCSVKSLSQEHGIVSCSSPFIDNVQIGDTIGILPVHSCLTADAMRGYTLTKELLPADHLEGEN